MAILPSADPDGADTRQSRNPPIPFTHPAPPSTHTPIDPGEPATPTIVNPGQTLDRETLLNRVWGYDWYGNARVVDTHVQHLRRKLRQCYPDEDLILTVRGVGYRFAA